MNGEQVVKELLARESLNSVSKEAKELIMGLVKVDPSKRLSATYALQSEWFTKDLRTDQSLNKTISLARKRSIMKKHFVDNHFERLTLGNLKNEIAKYGLDIRLSHAPQFRRVSSNMILTTKKKNQ